MQVTRKAGTFYFRSQLRLLFRQVPEQPSHHQKRHAAHKQMLGFKLDHIESQLVPMVAVEEVFNWRYKSQIYGTALQPEQNHRGGLSPYSPPETPPVSEGSPPHA